MNHPQTGNWHPKNIKLYKHTNVNKVGSGVSGNPPLHERRNKPGPTTILQKDNGGASPFSFGVDSYRSMLLKLGIQVIC